MPPTPGLKETEIRDRPRRAPRQDRKAARPDHGIGTGRSARHNRVRGGSDGKCDTDGLGDDRGTCCALPHMPHGGLGGDSRQPELHCPIARQEQRGGPTHGGIHGKGPGRDDKGARCCPRRCCAIAVGSSALRSSSDPRTRIARPGMIGARPRRVLSNRDACSFSSIMVSARVRAEGDIPRTRQARTRLPCSARDTISLT